MAPGSSLPEAGTLREASPSAKSCLTLDAAIKATAPVPPPARAAPIARTASPPTPRRLNVLAISPQTPQVTANVRASWSPTDGWINVARPRKIAGQPRRFSAPGPSTARRQGQPPQREPDQAVEHGRLEQVVRADVARLRRQDQDHRHQPDLAARVRPDRPGQAVDTEALVAPKGQAEQASTSTPRPARRADSPSRAGSDSPGGG